MYMALSLSHQISLPKEDMSDRSNKTMESSSFNVDMNCSSMCGNSYSDRNAFA